MLVEIFSVFRAVVEVLVLCVNCFEDGKVCHPP